AGTEHGVYASFDDGANWQSLQLDLPDVQVPDLVVEENDLVIATHGRSFYVLDDVAPLRQLSAQVARAKVHLYDPVDPVRGVDQGVAVYYYLKDSAQKVTLEFLDAQGGLIRSFTGTPADTVRREGEEDEDARFRPRDPSVPVKAGMHRFLWDLRYPGIVDFPGMILWSASTRGPRAAPGKYQVRLTVDGQPPQTQSFEVLKDPRLSDVALSELEEQFRLALRIRDKGTEANQAVLLIRGIKAQVDERVKQAEDAELTGAGEGLKTRLGAVEEQIYQVRNQSNQDPLNFPIRLNNKIAALLGVVESAEARPTDQAHAAFNDLSARLDTELARLNAVIEGDMARFNDLLRARGLPPVERKPLEPERRVAEE
ncbi:MAG: glycosyl hydrolase, partial [Gemmatimonadetes bacterium]|nr:glycosyl hydrolase [Gemmatimonadota bacterium]